MILKRSFLVVGLFSGMMYPALTACGQIYRLAEMNTRQIRALDLQRTVVLIPGGILEEHGPYLPSYTDDYADEAYARELANAIVARSDGRS
jgi:creatinine amidohydrolase